MRNPLQKRIPRDLKKNFGKYLGMILILVCTISVGSSFQTTMNGCIEYLDGIKEGNYQEDGFFEVGSELRREQLDKLTENHVAIYENFYVTDNHFGEDSKVILFDEREEVDLPTIFEGQLPKAADEIAIDHVFARSNEIAVGDRVTLLGREYQVVGTVSLPDYSSLFMNNTDLVMNTTHFGVSVLSHEGFETAKEKNITYRYSYRHTDRNLSDADKQTVSEDMMKQLFTTGSEVLNFLRADQNQSISFLEMDIGTDGPFMQVFVYMLVMLIAFVFAILTNSNIESESVIIGTLRASGFTKGEIIRHYLQPTLIVAILGSAIGNLLGYTVMIQPFLDVYYNTYSVGPIHIRFDVPSFVLTTVLPVVIMIVINYWMMFSKMSLSPLKFLRKELKKGKNKKAVKLPNVSFLGRFRMRVILQNKGSYVMLFLGVFLASFLLMFGIGLDPLMNHYTDSVDESLAYDYQYLMKAPVDTDAGEKVSVYEMDTWFALGKKDIGVTCYGIEKESTFFADAWTEEGVTISSALAKKLHLAEGDTLLLHDKNKDKEHTFEITGIYEYTAAMAMFMPKETLNDLLEKDADYYNCILSDEALDINENAIAKQITRADMLGAAKQMLDSFGTIIQFINLFSVVVYMILMYILTKVVIDKNAISIAYMKVFGYEKKEIRKLYLTTTSIVVVVSLIVCIPVEIAMFKLVLVYLSSMIEGYMEFYLPNTVYTEIIIIGIAAYYAINALHIRHVNQIPMTDALKSRE